MGGKLCPLSRCKIPLLQQFFPLWRAGILKTVMPILTGVLFFEMPAIIFFFHVIPGLSIGCQGEKNVITLLHGWKNFISHFIFAQLHLYGQIHSMNEASSIWYISLLIVIWDYVSSMLSYIIISTSYFFFPFYSLIFQVLFFFTLPFSFLLTLFLFSFHPSF